MSQVTKLLKPLLAYTVLLICGVVLAVSALPFTNVLLQVVTIASLITYIASLGFTQYFLNAPPIIKEVISLYQAGYTLFAGYLFVGITAWLHPSIAIVIAAPFAYFFPAVHVKCETSPEKNEEHLIPALNLLVALIATTAILAA